MPAQLGRNDVHDLSPQDVARGLAEGSVLLVDVREPNETAVERYPGAFHLPMSQFDPAAIPDPQGRQRGLRLPLGQSVGDRLPDGAGCRPSLQFPSRRRNYCLEGGRIADRILNVPLMSKGSRMHRSVGLILAIMAAGNQAIAQTGKERIVNVYNWSDYIATERHRRVRPGDRDQGPLRHVRFERHPRDQAPCRQVRIRRRRSDCLFPRAPDQGRRLPETGQEQAAEPGEPVARDRGAAGEVRSRQPIRRQLHVGHDRRSATT